MTRKQRTTEEVRQILKEYGYILDKDEDFKNVKEKMLVTTEEGYKIHVRFNDLSRYKPKFFHVSNPYTIWNIKNIWLPINAPNYELLDDVYRGNEFKMKWKHKTLDLPMLEMSWHCFQDQKQHPELGNKQAGESNRKETGTVLKQILYLLENEEKYDGWNMCNIEYFVYKDKKQIIEFEHVDGYKSLSTVEYILNKNGLLLFHTKQPEITLYNIEKYLELNGIDFKLKENQQYSGRQCNLIFICPEHGEFENNFNAIGFRKTDCPECMIEKISGANSIHWKEEFTYEDRMEKRHLQGVYKWSTEVKIRDRYQCQCCGARNTQLHAHHLDAYSWCKEKRTDVNNGITLCHLCHKDAKDSFHRMYSNKGNTREQFLEWIRLYRANDEVALETLKRLEREVVNKCV